MPRPANPDAERKAIPLTKSKRTSELFDKLCQLGEKLRCKPQALVWDAVEKMLANPPKEAPKGAMVSHGVAAGFWLCAIVDPSSGVAKKFVVQEVARRSDTTGHTFISYKRNDDGLPDEKARDRALKQAKKAAEGMSQLMGIKFSEKDVKLLG